MATESLDDLYIHTRALMKSCNDLVRGEPDNAEMTYGGPTDYMRQLDDLNQLAEGMVRNLRTLAWNLEYRIKAAITAKRAAGQSPGSEAP